MNKARRYNNGKPKLHHLFTAPDACAAMATTMEYGAKKYGYCNWKGGFDDTEAMDSVLRHLSAYVGGEITDGESGLNHLWLALSGLFMHVDNLERDRKKDRGANPGQSAARDDHMQL